jgi:hypothetical protein
MSTDFGRRVIAAAAESGEGAQNVPTQGAEGSETTLTFQSATVAQGVNVSTSTNDFEVQESGLYFFSAKIRIGIPSGISGAFIIKPFLNGNVVDTRWIRVDVTNSGSTFDNKSVSASKIIRLNAGDKLSFRMFQNSGAARVVDLGRFDIHKIQSPETLLGSEKVIVSYSDSSGQVFPASSTYNALTFSTKIEDTHAAFSSGIFTAPFQGSYRLSINLTVYKPSGYTAAEMWDMRAISNNGQQALGRFTYSNTVNTLQTGTITRIFKLNAGDTITLTKGTPGYAGAAPIVFAAEPWQSLSIEKI